MRGWRRSSWPAQSRTGTSWVWDEDYRGVREDAALLLDLMGYVPAPEIEHALENAVSLRDPRLASLAAVSLLRLGRDVDPSTFERGAADAEVRNWLFDELQTLGKGEKFPEAWATQEAFAESELVTWSRSRRGGGPTRSSG